MFTGIIEEVGTLLATRKASKSESLTIEAPYVLQDAKVGDSIAVNGICPVSYTHLTLPTTERV